VTAYSYGLMTTPTYRPRERFFLLEVLLYREGEALPAVRKRTARALASLHLGNLGTPQRHSLPDEVAGLERPGETLKWACSHLDALPGNVWLYTT
jgi:hypothetical protein